MQGFRIAMLIGLLAVPAAVPAFAQFTPGFKLNDTRELSDEEKERNKANEAAAKAARSKIPDAKPSSDPWATVRTEPSSGAAHKTAKPKTVAK